jgi:hypothetical protein
VTPSGSELVELVDLVYRMAAGLGGIIVAGGVILTRAAWKFGVGFTRLETKIDGVVETQKGQVVRTEALALEVTALKNVEGQRTAVEKDRVSRASHADPAEH